MSNPPENDAPPAIHDPLMVVDWYAQLGLDDCLDEAAPGLYGWDEGAPTPLFPRAAPPAQRAASAQPRGAQVTPAPAPKTPTFAPAQNAQPSTEAVDAAKAAAAKCTTIGQLRTAVTEFDDCPLKRGARNTVFADGVEGAPLMVIGEAPGRDEDAAGRPFVGRAGQLLDRMLGAIGQSRDANSFITNVVYWRPPANRTPTPIEVAICAPFVNRLIELSKPKAILLAGKAPAAAFLGVSSITRARGKWGKITTDDGQSFDALPIFHPAFLLRQPAQKRATWQDLQALQQHLGKSDPRQP